MGATGWGWDDILPYFKKAENWQVADEATIHGENGPLMVSKPSERSPLTETFIKACQQAGIPFNPDLNGTDIDGCGYFPATLKNSQRGNSAYIYLTLAMERPNLTVKTDATVLSSLTVFHRFSDLKQQRSYLVYRSCLLAMRQRNEASTRTLPSGCKNLERARL